MLKLHGWHTCYRDPRPNDIAYHGSTEPYDRI